MPATHPLMPAIDHGPARVELTTNDISRRSMIAMELASWSDYHHRDTEADLLDELVRLVNEARTLNNLKARRGTLANLAGAAQQIVERIDREIAR